MESNVGLPRTRFNLGGQLETDSRGTHGQFLDLRQNVGWTDVWQFIILNLGVSREQALSFQYDRVADYFFSFLPGPGLPFPSIP